MTISASPCLIVSRKNPRRCGSQVYSIVAPRSSAMSWAILFSKPSSLSLLNGRLFGSAAMRSTGRVVCASPVAAATNSPMSIAAAGVTKLREAEDIERASLCRVLGQVLHRVDEAERGAGISDIQVAGDHRARPTSHAGKNRDILLAVRTLERGRLPDDAAAALELPKRFPVVGIDRAEAAVHRPEKD